ncbi:MAG: NAD(P)-dependent oxidoreductase [Planctomycetes bacterium]|nr:NAD(P)-dependent oxidoreductase [Planctomycetota bacterium]
MKRFLLTGATGFIGGHCLTRLAASGHTVHAVSRHAPPEDRQGVVWHHMDLLEPRAIDGLLSDIRPTHLMHMAWGLAPNDLYGSLHNFPWVAASLQLVQSFQQHGGQRCLVVGTCYEYDQQYGYCSERLTPTIPSTTYGTCKNALRQLLDAFSRTVDLSLAWPRLFYLFGPGENQRRLVSSVIVALLRGEVAACSHGRQLRDYMYVEDAADGLFALLESDLQGPMNLGLGVPIALRDLVRAVGERLGRPDLIRLGAVEARSIDVPLVVADTTRSTTELHWQPRFSLDEGLDRTIAWWKRQLSNRETQSCHGS